MDLYPRPWPNLGIVQETDTNFPYYRSVPKSADNFKLFLDLLSSMLITALYRTIIKFWPYYLSLCMKAMVFVVSDFKE